MASRAWPSGRTRAFFFPRRQRPPCAAACGLAHDSSSLALLEWRRLFYLFHGVARLAIWPDARLFFPRAGSAIYFQSFSPTCALLLI
jgi:hypothetical protein